MNIPGAEDLSLRPGRSPPSGFPGSRRRRAGTGEAEPLGQNSDAGSERSDSPLEGDFVIDVRIETFKAIHVARIRHVGPVMDMGPCFERLLRWAASVGA